MTIYIRGNIFLILIVLFTSSTGCAATQHLNQGVLADSKIKKSSFKKKIIRRISKALPKHLTKCVTVVTDVRLLRADDEFNVAEEWTVDACQESKVFFVSTSTFPKGHWIDIVKTKEERYAQEKEALRSTLDWLDDERYRGSFYYLEEILNDDEFKKWIEEDKNTQTKVIEYTIDGIPHHHTIKVKNQSR